MIDHAKQNHLHQPCSRPHALGNRRLGFDEDDALTLGKAGAGLNAQAKGRRLGIFKKPTEARARNSGSRSAVVQNTKEGIRAEPIDPDGVRRYLESKFGDDLKRVRTAMEKLAKLLRPKQLAVVA